MTKQMTKAQLVTAMAEEMGTDKKTAGAALEAITGLITKEVANGGSVTLPGIAGAAGGLPAVGGASAGASGSAGASPGSAGGAALWGRALDEQAAAARNIIVRVRIRRR